MTTGGGKQHGRYFLAHSVIDPATIPTLREVRRSDSTTSSDVPIQPRRPSSTQMMVVVQSDLAELRAQQAAQEEAHRQQLAAQEEAHRQQLEAYRRQLEAMQEHSARQMKEFASFFQGLEIPGFRCPPLPASFFAPPPCSCSTPCS